LNSKRAPRRLELEQTRGRDHDPCDEGGEAREQQQIMQDDGHRNSSLQRRGRARISRPEGGGDCYVSAKWGQLAVHRCMIELSGDSSSARMEPGDRRTAGFRPGSCPLWVNHDHCGPSHMIAHVRFAPKADKTAGASARLLSANRVLTRCSKHHRYSITSSARASMMEESQGRLPSRS